MCFVIVYYFGFGGCILAFFYVCCFVHFSFVELCVCMFVLLFVLFLSYFVIFLEYFALISGHLMGKKVWTLLGEVRKQRCLLQGETVLIILIEAGWGGGGGCSL